MTDLDQVRARLSTLKGFLAVLLLALLAGRLYGAQPGMESPDDIVALSAVADGLIFLIIVSTAKVRSPLSVLLYVLAISFAIGYASATLLALQLFGLFGSIELLGTLIAGTATFIMFQVVADGMLLSKSTDQDTSARAFNGVCSRCGAPLPSPPARFCQHCGAPLTAAPR